MKSKFKSGSIKRLLSVILSLTMMFSVLVFTTSAEEASDRAVYTPSEDYAEAKEFLEILGVLGDEPLDITQNVSRGQFVDLYMKALNLDSVDNETRVFSDVLRSHPYYESITSAYNLGLVSGIGSGLFEPDKEMKYDFCKSLVYKAIGLDSSSKKHYHFTKNLNVPKNGDGISYENAVVLIYNMLMNNVVNVSYKSNSIEYAYNEDVTLLNYLWNVYEIEGVVNATPVASLSSQDGCPDSYIEIDYKRYVCNLTNTYKYLGYDCKVLVSYEDSDPKVLGLTIKDTNEDLLITSIQMEDGCFDGKSISYETESGKLEKANIEPDACVLYNGAFAGSQFEKNIFDFDCGEVSLIDSDGNKKYDIVKIFDYKYISAATKPSGERLMVYDRFNPKEFVSFQADDNTVIEVEIDGKPATVNDIVTQDLLCVAQSPEGSKVKYISVRINRSKVTGTLTERSEEQFTIGGKELYVSEKLLTEPIEKGDIPTMGAIGTYSLDYLGRAALYEAEVGTDVVYGVLVEIGATGNGLSKGIEAKFFTTGSDVIIYKTDKYLLIDGVKYTDANLAREKLLETKFSIYEGYDTICQLVKYKVDDEGYLRAIYTAYSGDSTGKDNNYPQISHKFGLRQYKSAGNHWFGTTVRDFKLDSTTLLVYVPNPDENGKIDASKIYRVLGDSLSDMTSAKYQSQAYGCNNTGIAEAIVFGFEYKESFPTSAINYLVADKRVGYNEKGELCNKFTLMSNGRPFKYETRDETIGAEVGRGDQIQVVMDVNEVIQYVNIVLDIDAPKLLHGVIKGADYYGSANRVTIGYIESYDDSVARITYDKYKSADVNSEPLSGFSPIGGVYYNMYYVGAKEATEGQIADLPNYVSTDGEDYMIFLHESSGVVKDYTIYVLE